MLSPRLLEELAATVELCGSTYSPAAARILAADLEGFPEPAISRALRRCRLEVKGRLTPAEIISRIDDGHPTAEEAWSLIPRTEEASAVWTDQMREAYFVARPLLEARDQVAARMAFKERYSVLLAEAREHKEPPKWTASLGADPHERASVLTHAVEQGRLGVEYAAGMLDHDQAQQLYAIAGRRDLLISHDPAGRERVTQLLAGVKGER